MVESAVKSERLTGHQKLILTAAVLGDMLEFFDYFLIGFILAFIIKPWHLTFGEAGTILLTSGIGAIVGALYLGHLADRFGRRPLWMTSVLIFSIATPLIALTPTGNWVYLSIMRFFVGLGVGGLYVIDMPLVQEYVPTRIRGLLGGIVTAMIPVGSLLGSFLAAFVAPIVGWRPLLLFGLIPAAITLLVRYWVPESPRWLIKQGRMEDAKKSVSWAFEIPESEVKFSEEEVRQSMAPKTRWIELFKYPRNVILGWVSMIGLQTVAYGIELWATSLFAVLYHIPASRAAYLYLFVTLGFLVGRFTFSGLSEAIGRRLSGIILGIGVIVLPIVDGLMGNKVIHGIPLLWALMIPAGFFFDGGFALLGPYVSEIWPTELRASGMGSSYGIGSIGKFAGPVGMAIIAGVSNFISPPVVESAVLPAFIYLGAFGILVLLPFVILPFETKGKTLEEIEGALKNKIMPKAQSNSKP